jgi:hypothetical protein
VNRLSDEEARRRKGTNPLGREGIAAKVNTSCTARKRNVEPIIHDDPRSARRCQLDRIRHERSQRRRVQIWLSNLHHVDSGVDSVADLLDQARMPGFGLVWHQPPAICDEMNDQCPT